MIKASAIIAAGGAGKRMGRPKQLLPLCGSSVLEHTLDAFIRCGCFRRIIVVTTERNFDKIKKIKSKFRGLVFAPAGATRLESVLSGLKAAEDENGLIAVHDGARPLVCPKDIRACLQAAQKHGAAVLAVALKDTVKFSKDGKFIDKTLKRAQLFAAQTPQCYRADILKKALAKYGKLKQATDESQLVEKTGVKVALVPSSYANIKITTPEDLITAEALCKAIGSRKLK